LCCVVLPFSLLQYFAVAGLSLPRETACVVCSLASKME
jgi:hypothetical protein